MGKTSYLQRVFLHGSSGIVCVRVCVCVCVCVFSFILKYHYFETKCFGKSLAPEVSRSGTIFGML